MELIKKIDSYLKEMDGHWNEFSKSVPDDLQALLADGWEETRAPAGEPFGDHQLICLKKHGVIKWFKVPTSKIPEA